MNCFYYLREKSRARRRRRTQKSAPILQTQTDQSITASDISLDYQSSDRAYKSSSCSAASPRSIPELYEEKGQNLRVFTYSELRQATNNFNRLLKIGEGGFGCVYKGTIRKPIDDGENLVVAIKKLNKDGYQGHKQWVAEVQFLGVVEHPNLVKLIGYCAVDGERGIQRLLVYEYMPNKSLEHHLFNRAYPPLSWDRRLQIALGAAQGLAYLHEELEIQVIYRDFKSSNVLLGDDFMPKLSDFGLAREGPTAGHTHVSTAVVGTYGYAAPEYIETGHLTSKSDVWSFGVVLYEILTGRRALERDRPKSEQKLLEWVKLYPADSRRFVMIMDPRLGDKYSLSAARKVAKLADSCLVKSAKDRPKMSQVVESLKQIVSISSGSDSPPPKCVDEPEDNPDQEKPGKQIGLSESAKRRIAQLVKLGEHHGGVSRRRFLIMQRAKVT